MARGTNNLIIDPSFGKAPITLVLRFISLLNRSSTNYKMNHFVIKEKIYIEALKVAYEKVEDLMVA